VLTTDHATAHYDNPWLQRLKRLLKNAAARQIVATAAKAVADSERLSRPWRAALPRCCTRAPFFRSLYVLGPESVWHAEESAEKRRLGKKNLKTPAAEAEPIFSTLRHDW